MSKETLHYEIRQLVPALGYRAVFSHLVDRADPSGPIVFTTESFDYLAVAEVKAYEGSEMVDEAWSEVVPVELMDGYFQVLNECCNFHGIVRYGDSWDVCKERLPLSLRERAQQPDEQTLEKFNGQRVVKAYRLADHITADMEAQRQARSERR